MCDAHVLAPIAELRVTDRHGGDNSVFPVWRNTPDLIHEVSVMRDVKVRRAILRRLTQERDGVTPNEVLVREPSEHVRALIHAEELRLDVEIGFIAVLSRRASGGYFRTVSSKDINLPA